MKEQDGQDLYRQSGVNISAGNEAARRYGKLAEVTSIAGVLGRIGGFAGGFELDLEQFSQPVLFSGTDGVGTKLKLAFATQCHNTVGVDCVAMCVNDILTAGAKPLFFLDYLATGQLDVDVAEQIVAGIAAGCGQAGCALIGGETAEMPGMYAQGEYDLAGFTVGAADKAKVVDGSRIEAGNVVLGLASNGLHSNGFSLVRKVVADAGLDWGSEIPFCSSRPGMSLGEELLTPTRIYVRPVLHLLSQADVLGMAHITGGGLLENIPRVLPKGLGVKLDVSSWEVPPVFRWLQEQTEMDFEACARVWNMGIGFVVIVREEQVQQAMAALTGSGEEVRVIGTVQRGCGVTLTL